MCTFGFGVAAWMWFAPEALLSFFTADRDVIERGVPYLRILAPCQAFACLEIVLNGAFSGAGETLPPSIISVTVSLLRIPLAGWIAHTLGLGLNGIAWTIALTCVVRALIVLGWFRRGRWKTKQPATAIHPLPAPDPTH
jgi:Na+-driven multidrug efflux pump